MVSALIFGALLQPFSPGRLVQVIQGVAVMTVLLNFIALWKQEPRRHRGGVTEPAADPSFLESWQRFCRGQDAVRRLIIVGLGTMGFGMADVVLEPYGGEVLGLSVAATTKLTALLAFGGLAGFAAGWLRLAKGGDAYRIAQVGAILGVPAFGLVILAAPAGVPSLFLLGNFLVGFAGALFWHGTLTATMNLAPAGQAGLALGAWGAVQATAAGLAMSMSGILRDVMTASLATFDRVLGVASTAAAYISVYGLEILLLLVTVVATIPLIRRANAEGGRQITATADARENASPDVGETVAAARDAAE
jgi:BCD family chlorophyll transporter-like MFS transporter